MKRTTCPRCSSEFPQRIHGNAVRGDGATVGALPNDPGVDCILDTQTTLQERHGDTFCFSFCRVLYSSPRPRWNFPR